VVTTSFISSFVTKNIIYFNFSALPPPRAGCTRKSLPIDEPMATDDIIPTGIPLEDDVEDGEGGDAPVRAAWDGSNVTPVEIAWLYKTRRIPP
jgi:hypothetical protein